MKKKLLLAALLAVCTIMSTYAQTFYVRQNLAGYDLNRPKKILVMADQNSSASTWQLKDTSNTVVASGTLGTSLVGVGAHTPKAFNFNIDLTAVKTAGTYQLFIASKNVSTIKLLDNPYKPIIIDEILRLFRVRRSGTTTALDHQVSHLGDSLCPVFVRKDTFNTIWNLDATKPKLNLIGGWYDAGDYIKFTHTIAYATYNLLRSYEAYPALFEQKKYSTTNLIDILDEAKFGLDFLARTLPNNNQFVIQTGGYLDHEENSNYPPLNARLPENDKLNGKREAYVAFSKPQMGLAAAALALGAKILAAKGVDVSNYTSQATKIFAIADTTKQTNAWWQSASEVFYKDPTSEDNLTLAAIELYNLTGTATYKTKAIAYAKIAQAAYWVSYGDLNGTANARVVQLTADATVKGYVTTDLNSFKTFGAAAGNVWNLPMDYNWGALNNYLGAAAIAGNYELATNDATYRNNLIDIVDYALGKNNWGESFVSSAHVTKSFSQSYLPYYKINTSLKPYGDICQGPSDFASYSSEPFNYPNTFWETEFNTTAAVFYDRSDCYVTSESTVGGLADGLFAFTMASKLLSTPILTGINDNELNNNHLAIYPNPFNDGITIESNEAIESISISDVNGKELFSQNYQNLQNSVSIQQLNTKSGFYFVKIKTANNVIVKKIEKI